MCGWIGLGRCVWIRVTPLPCRLTQDDDDDAVGSGSIVTTAVVGDTLTRDGWLRSSYTQLQIQYIDLYIDSREGCKKCVLQEKCQRALLPLVYSRPGEFISTHLTTHLIYCLGLIKVGIY